MENHILSALEALRAARAEGIDLGIEGDRLAVGAPAEPPAAILDALARHKPQIIDLLRPGRDGWSAEDWLSYFDERAGVAEFDGGLPRPQAEARAFACCVAAWLDRNTQPSPPDRCAACGGGSDPHDILRPHLVTPAGHVWLHARCWPAWQAERRAEAVAALGAMGVRQAPDLADDFGTNGGA